MRTLAAFLSFKALAVSSMLSPEEIISSIIRTVFPSTEEPKNSWATIGFLAVYYLRVISALERIPRPRPRLLAR